MRQKAWLSAFKLLFARIPNNALHRVGETYNGGKASEDFEAGRHRVRAKSFEALRPVQALTSALSLSGCLVDIAADRLFQYGGFSLHIFQDEEASCGQETS